MNKISTEGQLEKGKNVRSSQNSFVDIRHHKWINAEKTLTLSTVVQEELENGSKIKSGN